MDFNSANEIHWQRKDSQINNDDIRLPIYLLYIQCGEPFQNNKVDSWAEQTSPSRRKTQGTLHEVKNPHSVLY